MTSSSKPTQTFEFDKQALEQCLLQDSAELLKLSQVIQRRLKQKLPSDKLLAKFANLQEKSQKLLAQRKQLAQRSIDFDQLLPVCQQKEAIAKLIKEHQVVVVAGETGSGKTTQLPKICLELGLGQRGRIGHTQPRRVAATSVARRIAEELQTPLGQIVGYSIRFNDQVQDSASVRVMTDGILLNEISFDPLLLQYDTLIIDEAHERSLNIDFILGYLKNLLPKRPDLKIIITSATIDVERFAEHFAIKGKSAPIIEVSGRTYPVEVWYRDNDEEKPLPQVEQIGHAVEELMVYAAGDILVFLSGEAEIRETARFLRKERFLDCQVLPLYARLSMAEQEKIFKPSGGKGRIVLATNVAETSITVPGIRFVIDPGFARISRYSVRNKIQRLPIEKISQASANQRKGRCGRVADGICIRLYSEEDFTARPEFTDAEILRTNLASVILQMQQARLGLVEDFPFLDMPSAKQVSDGLNLLIELEAINNKDKRLTLIGKEMAKLPIEPRLARILIEGRKRKILQDTLVIAAFLSVKDPREWPFDKKELAQQKHRKYQHSQSDFIGILNLWRDLHQQQEELSNRQFRNHCQQELINFTAYREWRSTYRQLKSLTLFNAQDKAALGKLSQFDEQDKKQEAVQYQALHQALLSGLLSFVGQKDVEKGYLAARQSKYFIHPQSVNFKKQPAWLMAFEVVETTQAYARLTAFIEVKWLEQSARHLLKTHYFEPFWSKSRGTVLAPMQQTLYGLKVVIDRKVDYSSIEPELCRKFFIEHGLVKQELNVRHQFFLHNQKVMQQVEQEIAKTRQADLRISDSDLTRWFDQRLPQKITNTKQLNQWLKQSKNNQKQLVLTKEQLLQTQEQDHNQFPVTIKVKGIELELNYHFEPGHEADGVTVKIPQSLKSKFVDKDFERLVPGLLAEKIEFMLRSMPKRFRKNFLPIPVYAQACYEAVIEQQGALQDIISKQLYKMTGVILTQEAWSELKLPEHLKMHFELVDDSAKSIRLGRSLEIKNNPANKTSIDAKFKKKLQNKAMTYSSWDFDFQTESSMLEAGVEIPLYHAIEDAGTDKIRLVSSVSRKQAQKTHLQGVCRLIAIANQDKLKYLLKNYQAKQSLSLALTSLATYQDMVESVFLAGIKSLVAEHLPTNKTDYENVLSELSPQLISVTTDALDKLKYIVKKRSSILASIKSLSKNFKALKEDVAEQLDYLFVDNFVYRFGIDKLKDYQRYMLALETRITKAKENLLKEAQAANQINAWLDERIDLDESDKIPDFEYQEYLWMLEEFRISLFAQGQKTQFPISEKRLQKFIEQLKSRYF